MRNQVLAGVVLLCCFSGSVHAITWTTVDYPGAHSTYIGGIEGGNVVGMYGTSSRGDDAEKTQ